MSNADAAVLTRRFYERYRFPGNRPLDQDGLILLRHFTQAVEALRAKKGDGPIRVLDAGCGTGNTSVALARNLSAVQFLGIDQSRHSLQKARESALNEGLQNLQFRRWDLLKPLPNDRLFDLVLCLGVLHHTPDMKTVLLNLRRVMKKTGRLFLWIYGKYGRSRHMMNVRALQLLVKKAGQDQALNAAIEFIRHAGKKSVIADLLGNIPADELQRKAFEDPVWVADQFLNPHEELLDMEEALALLRSAGFSIRERLGGPGQIESWLDSPLLLERYGRLTNKEQQIVLDLIAKPDRYFFLLQIGKQTIRK